MTVRRLLLSAILLSALLGQPARAEQAAPCEEADPAQCATQSCFKLPLPAYLVALSLSGQSVFKQLDAVSNACSDLHDEMFQDHGFQLANINGYLARIFKPPFVDIPTVFSQMFGGTTLSEYQTKLAEIGKIENRYERIKKVYQLAVSAQGNYGDASAYVTPAHTMGRAKDTGTGGKCNEFSNLLSWSLNQVNRSPTLAPDLKSMGVLDENSFISEVVATPDSSHAWVEVRLPVGMGDNQHFEVFHLDSTEFKDQYSPLFPRERSIDDGTRQSLVDQCHAVTACLEKLSIAIGCKTPEGTKAVGSAECH